MQAVCIPQAAWMQDACVCSVNPALLHGLHYLRVAPDRALQYSLVAGDVTWRVTLISQGVHPLWGVKQVWAGKNTLFSSKMRQYHSPDGADGDCITSNKLLTCLQLVFTSNWSNFRRAGLPASAKLSFYRQHQKLTMHDEVDRFLDISLKVIQQKTSLLLIESSTKQLAEAANLHTSRAHHDMIDIWTEWARTSNTTAYLMCCLLSV